MNEQNNYTGYEYRQVTVDTHMESMWKDSMVNFGWKAERSEAKIVKRLPFALWIMAAPLSLLPWRPFQKQLSDHESANKVNITFKRDRNIAGKAELTRLQNQFESCAHEIEILERSKTTMASIVAYLIGILGTGLMAGSMFAYLAGAMPLMVVLAVPGVLGWILPYFCYQTLQKNKSRKIAPVIAKKNDEIYAVCELGYQLLSM